MDGWISLESGPGRGYQCLWSTGPGPLVFEADRTRRGERIMRGTGRVATLAVMFMLTSMTSDAGAAGWRVTIGGGPATWPAEAPVIVAIDAAVPPGAYLLVPAEGGGGTPAQVLSEGGKTWLAFIARGPAPAAPRRFRLEGPTPTNARGTSITVADGKDLELSVGGKLLTVYRAGETAKPYFYPLIGPTGASYTRSYPMRTDVAGEKHDHPHQRSFWFTHGDVNGTDFWGSDPLNGDKPNFGSIRETSRHFLSGPVVGVLRTTDAWLDHQGKPLLDDERVFRFHATASTRVVDFEVRLKASHGPIVFGDTKEGMFGLRVASSMDVSRKEGGRITNAEGLQDDRAWGKPSSWVDYTGPVEGKTVGIAILNHPSSFRYPTTWHVRTYGLFAANPFGWHDFGQKQTGRFTLPAGESIGFAYRLVLHEGDTARTRVADHFQFYAGPPKVEVVAD